jgi:hypothetical protein
MKRGRPLLSLVLESRHDGDKYVLGRRKLKTAGGFPTQTHGLFLLLEVLVPFIEISRP